MLSEYRSLAAEFNSAVFVRLKTAMKQDSKDMVRADNLTDLMVFLASLRSEFGDRIGRRILDGKLKKNLALIDAWSRDKTVEALNRLQARYNTPQPSSVTGRPTPKGQSGELWMPTVNIRNAMTGDLLDAAVRRNVGLIKSIQEDHLEMVTQAIKDGFISGKSRSDIIRDIRGITGANEAKARFWARDQASKFFGEVTKERQTSAGIPGYIWRTLKDGRVRDSHAAVDGKYFEWKNPPAVGARGKAVHPGEDFNCRCWAEPAFGPDYADKDVSPADPLAYMNYNRNGQNARVIKAPSTGKESTREFKGTTDYKDVHLLEGIIKNQKDYESLCVFDRSGTHLSTIKGDKTSVSIPANEIERLRDAIVYAQPPYRAQV